MLALAAGLALGSSCVWAQDGLQGALSRTDLGWKLHPGTFFVPTLAAADLDGDNQPDGAILADAGWGQRTVHTIELHFSGRENVALTFESREPALAISALDVNQDGATDIIVEQPFTHKRIQVWLNDGHGGFRQGRTQDFLVVTGANGQQVQPDTERQVIPALCLPSRVNFEIAPVPVSGSSPDSSSHNRRSGLIAWAVETPATASTSPRSPPRFSRL